MMRRDEKARRVRQKRERCVASDSGITPGSGGRAHAE